MAGRLLRVGVIGTGFGARVHIPAFKLDPRVQVVAVCSADPDRARQAALQLDVPLHYDDYHRMLGEADLDIVSVASPPDLHFPMVMAAISHRAHVLCEKPLAPTLSHAAEMAQAASDARVVSAVGFERRLFPHHLAIERLLREEAIGRVTGGSVALFSWPRPSFPDPAWDWLSDAERGGGVVGLHGSHYFDLLRNWLGEIRGVFCRTARIEDQRLVPGMKRRVQVTSEDSAAIVLEFDGHLLVSLHLSVAAPQGTGARLELHGTRGRLMVNERRELFMATGEELQHPSRVEFPPGDTSIPESPPELRPYSQLVDRFISAIVGGTSCEPGFAAGLASVAVMEACKKSASTGSWMPVPLLL
jgi:predicted dehydrogenase